MPATWARQWESRQHSRCSSWTYCQGAEIAGQQVGWSTTTVPEASRRGRLPSAGGNVILCLTLSTIT